MLEEGEKSRGEFGRGREETLLIYHQVSRNWKRIRSVQKDFFYLKLFCQIYLAGGFAGSLIVHQNIATLSLRLSVTDKES